MDRAKTSPPDPAAHGVMRPQAPGFASAPPPPWPLHRRPAVARAPPRPRRGLAVLPACCSPRGPPAPARPSRCCLPARGGPRGPPRGPKAGSSPAGRWPGKASIAGPAIPGAAGAPGGASHPSCSRIASLSGRSQRGGGELEPGCGPCPALRPARSEAEGPAPRCPGACAGCGGLPSSCAPPLAGWLARGDSCNRRARGETTEGLWRTLPIWRVPAQPSRCG